MDVHSKGYDPKSLFDLSGKPLLLPVPQWGWVIGLPGRWRRQEQK